MTSNQLDIEQPGQLLEYLRGSGRIGASEVIQSTALSGGVSNRTVLVTRASGKAWVMKQALAQLRTKVEWFSDPMRIHREAAGIRWLGELAPPETIPKLIFEDHEHHLLAMEAVPAPHENWKMMLLQGRVEPKHVEQFAAIAGAIHRRAAESTQPLKNIFADRSFFESLRLEPYYAYTATQVPQAAEFLHELIAQTRQRQLTLVHGDYSPKNILVHGGRLILLDHEVIHWGDPTFDLGFALTHLLSKAHHLRQFHRQFYQAASTFIDVYAATVGPVYWDANLQAMAVRHTLGCMLARVAGRSTLEYLSDDEKRRQQGIIVELMQHAPPTIEALAGDFIGSL